MRRRRKKQGKAQERCFFCSVVGMGDSNSNFLASKFVVEPFQAVNAMERAAVETVLLCLVVAGVGPLSLSRRLHTNGRSLLALRHETVLEDFVSVTASRCVLPCSSGTPCLRCLDNHTRGSSRAKWQHLNVPSVRLWRNISNGSRAGPAPTNGLAYV